MDRGAVRIVDTILAGAATFGNLSLHTLHEKRKLPRLMIPLGLLAHLLEILRSIRHAIGHEGDASVPVFKEGIA
jgi:hypothetical protein